MYIPAHFANKDLADMHRILRDHPSGALVMSRPTGQDANPSTLQSLE